MEQEVLRLPWRTILEWPLAVPPPSWTHSESTLLGAIPLRGTWSGWLTLRCDVGLAHEIAKRVRRADLVRGVDLDDAMRWLLEQLATVVQLVADAEAVLGEAIVLDAEGDWLPRSCKSAARLRFASGERLLIMEVDERVSIESVGAPVADREDRPFAEPTDDPAFDGERLDPKPPTVR